MNIDLLLRFLITWALPGLLSVIVGYKKGRLGFGVAMGIIFGGLGFVIGLWLGWVGFVVVCCFKKRQDGKETK